MNTLIACVFFIAVLPNYAHAETLQLPIANALETLDPDFTVDPATLGVLSNVYETLYRSKVAAEENSSNHAAAEGQILPGLADGFPAVSRDGLTYTIRIRKNVFFGKDSCFANSPGQVREVTASDVIYSLKRLSFPYNKMRAWWVFDRYVVGYRKFHDQIANLSNEKFYPYAIHAQIDGLKALDEHTLQIRLNTPCPFLLDALSFTATSIVAREAVEKYRNSGWELLKPIGTGPYVMSHSQDRKKILLKRNPNYSRFAELANIDEVKLTLVRDERERQERFHAGEFDAIDINPEKNSTPIYGRFFFNMNDPVLGKNKAMRKSIRDAINANAESFRRILDPEKTFKQTENLYGIASEKKSSQTVTLDFIGVGERAQIAGKLFSKALAEIGLDCKVKYLDPAQLKFRPLFSDYQIAFRELNPEFDRAESELRRLISENRAPNGVNESQFNDPEFDRLYWQLERTVNSEERKKQIAELNAIVNEEVPWFEIYKRNPERILQPWLKESHLTFGHLGEYEGFRIERH